MNKRKSLSIFAGTAMVLSAMSVLAFAPVGGRVTTVIESADILREHDSLTAKKGTLIQAGDVLRTPVGGRLQWWMEDDSMLAMGALSQVRIDRFEPAGKRVTYTVERGALRVISGNVSPTVLTPIATITAIGTDFSTFICGAACSGKARAKEISGNAPVSVYVSVGQGRVRVQNAAGSVEAGKGQIVYVASATLAPTIMPKAPSIVVEAAIELEFEVGTGDFIPDLPIQPIPPVELPGSPS